MNYFTSDWHINEDRIGINGKPNLFYRPFLSVHDQNATITNLFCSKFKDGDTLWHLGDVVYSFDDEAIDILNTIRNSFPNSKFNLVLGNYDDANTDNLCRFFDNLYNDTSIDINGNRVYLNHYPCACKSKIDENDEFNFAITGHIHSLWKVQKNMINVGVDAWHFSPVSESEILFCWNAMQKFYDNNVFVGQ